MNYNMNEDERTKELVRNIGQNIVNLGYGRLMTEEEIEERNEKLRRNAKRDAIIKSILSCVRTIVYTPLSIAFHAVSFVTRGIGCVSAFGMLIGGYHLYKGISDITNGVSFGEINAFEKAVPFFIVPFIAYGISVITEKIYLYFENNAF